MLKPAINSKGKTAQNKQGNGNGKTKVSRQSRNKNKQLSNTKKGKVLKLREELGEEPMGGDQMHGNYLQWLIALPKEKIFYTYYSLH